jgi:hypothetical protein
LVSPFQLLVTNVFTFYGYNHFRKMFFSSDCTDTKFVRNFQICSDDRISFAVSLKKNRIFRGRHLEAKLNCFQNSTVADDYIHLRQTIYHLCQPFIILSGWLTTSVVDNHFKWLIIFPYGWYLTEIINNEVLHMIYDIHLMWTIFIYSS